VSLARVGVTVSTALFTGVLLVRVYVRATWATWWCVLVRAGSCRHGRGDRTRTCGLLLPKQAR
jgi:hypothetical protein